jgi:hypothetical protein
MVTMFCIHADCLSDTWKETLNSQGCERSCAGKLTVDVQHTKKSLCAQCPSLWQLTYLGYSPGKVDLVSDAVLVQRCAARGQLHHRLTRRQRHSYKSADRVRLRSNQRRYSLTRISLPIQLTYFT